MPTRKSKRIQYILSRARELAWSGDYEHQLRIEYALRGEGYFEAGGVLDDHWLREELDRICQKARAGER